MTQNEIATGLDHVGLPDLARYVRALPVIAACGHCGWARDATRSFVLCSKVTHNSLGWRVAVPYDHEPPAWCPMRGER